MRLLKYFFLPLILLQISCGSGGPLTPVESFNAVKSAVENRDIEAVVKCLSQSSLDKISRHNLMVKSMRSDQLAVLSVKYGYSQDKLVNLTPADSAALYFFSDNADIKLGRYFKEGIVSVDIRSGQAFVKTESGIELNFVREGPYWKFDLSDL